MRTHNSAENFFFNTHMNTCTSQKHFFLIMQKMRHSHSRIHRYIFPPLCVLIWSIFGLCTHTVMIIIIKKLSSCFLETLVALLHSPRPPSVRFPSFPSFHFPFLWLSTRVPSHTRFFLFFLFTLLLSHSLTVCLGLSVSQWAPGTAESAVPVPSQGGIEG